MVIQCDTVLYNVIECYIMLYYNFESVIYCCESRCTARSSLPSPYGWITARPEF